MPFKCVDVNDVILTLGVVIYGTYPVIGIRSNKFCKHMFDSKMSFILIGILRPSIVIPQVHDVA